LVSFYASHARNAKEKRQRFLPFSRARRKEYFGEVQRSGRTSDTPRALAVLFCSLFSLVDGAFSGREGEKKRERERFFVYHMLRRTPFFF